MRGKTAPAALEAPTPSQVHRQRAGRRRAASGPWPASPAFGLLAGAGVRPPCEA